jgi:hypothetical protein
MPVVDSHTRREVFGHHPAMPEANSGDLASLAAILGAQPRLCRLDHFAARFAPDIIRNVA